jgi:hypothetical protein
MTGWKKTWQPQCSVNGEELPKAKRLQKFGKIVKDRVKRHKLYRKKETIAQVLKVNRVVLIRRPALLLLKS